LLHFDLSEAGFAIDKDFGEGGRLRFLVPGPMVSQVDEDIRGVKSLSKGTLGQAVVLLLVRKVGEAIVKIEGLEEVMDDLEAMGPVITGFLGRGVVAGVGIIAFLDNIKIMSQALEAYNPL
jgi:hypothetical protein